MWSSAELNKTYTELITKTLSLHNVVQVTNPLIFSAIGLFTKVIYNHQRFVMYSTLHVFVQLLYNIHKLKSHKY